MSDIEIAKWTKKDIDQVAVSNLMSTSSSIEVGCREKKNPGVARGLNSHLLMSLGSLVSWFDARPFCERSSRAFAVCSLPNTLSRCATRRSKDCHASW